MSRLHPLRICACIAVGLLVAPLPHAASAQALKARGGARTSIHQPTARPAARPAQRLPASPPAQRPVPPRQGGGVHVNQEHNNNINVNVQGNHVGPPPTYHGDSHHGHDDHWDDWDDWDHHPFATASAVTAGVIVTNAIIGSIVREVPPQCVPVNINGITYQQCGTTWYQPQYAGTTVQYVVVVPPG